MRAGPLLPNALLSELKIDGSNLGSGCNASKVLCDLVEEIFDSCLQRRSVGDIFLNFFETSRKLLEKEFLPFQSR